ncbi:MAG: hypothetical protein C5B48_09760 [Candidatus Rokuibacteriota bacterium]|nr:MAG: hypothetical protein C5B48_09760 [Candidatus Rokubacteria bacterium]
MRSTFAALAIASWLVAGDSRAQSVPRTGAEVFQRMHDAYAGKWYRTLTFVQKTTQRRPNGTDTISTWYESLRQNGNRTELRIDMGDPSNGNGVLYTADSVWRVRDGKVVSANVGGNEFLPLIEGVYFNPVSQTVHELESTKIDMSRVSEGRYMNRRVWIIGATSPTDTTSPQIWVDVDRKVTVRAILSFAPNAPAFDIHLDGYVPIESAWLASRITMTQGGVPRQTEEYRDWKVNVELPAGLFDVATWTTAPHWATKRQ